MSAFSSTALGPASPLFRGRQAELARLKQICQDDVTSYTVIYGGHQNGKTSLLLQLEAALRPSAHVCAITFQGIPGATPEQAYAHIGQRVANTLPMGVSASTIGDAPGLTEFLTQVLQRGEVRRLVLLLDEFGAIPVATRVAVGYALRALFHNRHSIPALAKLQIIFSGGIELYDMVVTEASSLHNICEEIYLADLTRDEAVGLITDGLGALGMPPSRAVTIGLQVYAQVSGHPYLTQRIGGLLAERQLRGEVIGTVQIAQALRQIVQRGDPLLRQIQRDLREHKLEDAARRLLNDPPHFTRLDDEMVRLELIGMAKPTDTHWAPRNPLLAEVFGERLGVTAPVLAAEPAPPSEVVTAKKRRLAALELQQARYGIDCPAHIVIQIEDLRREIAQLNQAIAAPAPTEATPPARPDGEATDVASRPSTPIRRNTGQIPRPLPDWVPTLIRIPAGPFLMGSSDSDTQADDREKPQHRLTLPDYWIAKIPVTNDQFKPFVEGDGYRNQQYWTKVGWAWREEQKIIKPEYWDDAKWNGSDYPVVGVSWFEAVAYCRWLSKQTGHEFRLPSEAEWEKAARGPDGRIWPWGNSWEAGHCNSKEYWERQTQPQTSGGLWATIGQWLSSEQSSAEQHTTERHTTPVKQFAAGVSPYGVLDMAGNAWEWVATKWGKSYPYQLEDEWSAVYLQDGDRGQVIRGGSWYSNQKTIRGAYRNNFLPRNRHHDQGLRVASHSPLPGSES